MRNPEIRSDGQRYTGSSLVGSVLSRTRELSSLVALLILVMVAVGAIDAVFPFLNGRAVDWYVVSDGGGAAAAPVSLTAFALVYAALALLQGFLVWALIALAGKIEMGIMHRYRKDTFVHLQHLSLSYYDDTPAGWILSRLTSDVQRLGETVSWGIVDVVWGIAMMAGIAQAVPEIKGTTLLPLSPNLRIMRSIKKTTRLI